MDQKYVDVCEQLDWVVRDYGKEVELESDSPAGENLIVPVGADNFVQNVRDYAASFDVDEHVEMWVGSRGQRGVPDTIRELLDDAEDIKKMLDELATALEDVDKGGNDSEDTDVSYDDRVMAGIKYILEVGLNTVRTSTEEDIINCFEMAKSMGWYCNESKEDRLEAFRTAKELSAMTDNELLKFISNVISQ